MMQNEAQPMASSLLRFIALDEDFRLVACENTALVREAAARHGLRGLAAVALGRALGAVQLLATLSKGDERVTLQIIGDGPLRGVMADAWSDGRARGYVSEAVDEPASPDVRPRVSKVLGRRGTITLYRDMGLKDLYQGTGELIQGEIDEDVESYLRVSEQVPSAVGCEVLLDESGEVSRSVAFLVQGMPGTKEQEGDFVREAQHRLRTGLLRQHLLAGETDLALMAATLVEGALLRQLSETPLRFECPCNHERVTRALTTLGPEELEAMAEKDEGTELACQFCSMVYPVSAEELRSLASSLRSTLN